MLNPRPRRLLAFAGVIAALVAAPFLPADILTRADLLWISIISAASLNLLKGNAGQVSLGQAAFMAIGAYSAVLVERVTGANLELALPVGAAVAGVAGFLIGIPSLRFRGFYLSLTTLALHFAVVFVGQQAQVANGGLAGFNLPPPAIGPLRVAGDIGWYYFLTLFGSIVLIAFANLCRTKAGRAWAAIRDRDIAAAIIGVDVRRYKLLAFVVSSLVAGSAGVLQAYYLGNVSVETYSIDLAISYVAMVVIGGLGSIVGSVLGAIVVTQLPFVIQSLARLFPDSNSGMNFEIFDIEGGVFGLVIIMFLLFEPDGLVGVFKRIAHLVSRLWQPRPAERVSS